MTAAPDLQRLGFTPTTELLKYGGIGLTGLGVFLTMWALMSDGTGIIWRYWGRYTSFLERKLRAQFIWTKGGHIALGQVVALLLFLVAHAIIDIPFWWVITILIAVGPAAYVEKLRRDRVEQLEKQLDSFIVSLANALKTTPSIGAAFGSVLEVVQDPIRQEIELALKEMRVGSTLDQALLHMAGRIESRQFDTALSAVLIGRQVGGNLPKVLETTAATLREMARLDGVVRTKTAEGKMQLWVLGCLPAALVWGLGQLWKGYFNVLTQSVTGYVIIFACGAMWVSALVLARKILNVDI
jgi:tight adherence protein B